MPLFNRNTDRQHTQLAYRIKYFPYSQLSPKARELIVWKRNTLIRKGDIIDNCNETQEVLFHKGSLYKICWLHNTVPTEHEWNKKLDSYLVRCEFRRSPAIPELAIVLLSFDPFSQDLNNEHGAPL
jgi:DNA modification methylase